MHNSLLKPVGLLFILMLLCFSIILQLTAQEPEISYKQFPGLKEIRCTCIIHYDPANTEIICTTRDSLPQDHLLFTKESWGKYEHVILKTKIDVNTGIEYFITHDRGPSEDPYFCFYHTDIDTGCYIGLDGDELIIPGNGFIYQYTGPFNYSFDHRKKYKLENDSLIEISQPFYYVGLKSKTLIPITIYSDPDYNNVVDELPANLAVEVILADTDPEAEELHNYLIKTPNGLLGWINIHTGNWPFMIDSLKYIGD